MVNMLNSECYLFLPQVVSWHGTTSKTNQELWALWVSDYEEEKKKKKKQHTRTFTFTQKHASLQILHTSFRSWHHLLFVSGNGTNYHLVMIINFHILPLSTTHLKVIRCSDEDTAGDGFWAWPRWRKQEPQNQQIAGAKPWEYKLPDLW